MVQWGYVDQLLSVYLAAHIQIPFIGSPIVASLLPAVIWVLCLFTCLGMRDVQGVLRRPQGVKKEDTEFLRREFSPRTPSKSLLLSHWSTRP